jgi:hypothetical protein
MATFSDPANGFEVTLDDDIDDKVERLPEIKTSSKKAANDIAEYARSIAPVGGPDDEHAGAYRDGIEVQETKTGHRVIATDQKSAWMEFGIPSQGQAAHWTLRTAAAALGYKFKKGKA